MSGDYLWDGTGEPDPEVERLERLLVPLSLDRPAPAFPAPFRRERRAWGGALATLAAAAGLTAALAGVWLGRTPLSWEVASVAGAPRLAGDVLRGKGRLEVGQWLETDQASWARIKVGRIGLVEVAPRTRIGLVDAGRRHHRLTLPRGSVHAEIWAPPGRFLVDTPAATAVDMGCEYTLEVDDDGVGLLTVQSGWVGFEWKGRESFVPKGAHCVTRPGLGPGTPYYEDAAVELKRALDSYDFDAREPAERLAALRDVLAQARKKDALTLWHLLARVEEPQRPLVYERMAELVPPPQGVTRAGVLRGDRAMLDDWWDELDLGSASWWRLWKQPLPPQAR